MIHLRPPDNDRAVKSADLPRSRTPGRVPRVVALGGGTGLPAVLRALRAIYGEAPPPEAITAVVAVTDDGGSSGRLRQDFGIPPPGDARNCVAALASDSPFTALLQHRFEGGDLDGHAVGNMLLAALTRQLKGDFASAITALARMVGTGGRVFPVTAQNVHLKAEFESGEIIVGETAIAGRGRPIKRLTLNSRARALPQVIEALVNADVIIVGPGSLYTSILPVLLIEGIAPTIYGLQAKRIYVSNLMTQSGETDGFSLERHLDVIYEHVGLWLFDSVLVNTAPIPSESLVRYAQNCSGPVHRTSSTTTYRGARIEEYPMSWEVAEHKVRHDPGHLAKALRELAFSEMDAPSPVLAELRRRRVG